MSYLRILVSLLFGLQVCSLMAIHFKIPRLSPLPFGIESNKIGLNGEWQFDSSPNEQFWKTPADSNFNSIEVPGEWHMQGFKVDIGKEAAYHRTFNVPNSWENQRIKLRCNAIYSAARIFINGQEATSHLGGFTAFEVDVTEHLIIGGENRIDIGVICETIADSTASGSKYALHPLGGIVRDIYLFSLPTINFERFHYATHFDSTYVDSQLATQFILANESNQSQDELTLQLVLKDREGRVVAEQIEALPLLEANSTTPINRTIEVKQPHLWNPESPYLYTLSASLLQGHKNLMSSVRKVGFRQIEIRKNRVFVNNQPIKLRGVCRHEVMPLRGRSLVGDIWKRDVEIFKQGNVNYIRTSHYPPDEALLEACDELGMFVEVEAPFCWAHQAEVNEAMHYSTLINQHIEMVNRDMSHPSVLLWSLGNESLKYEEYFKEAGHVIKAMDPTRPRIFSQWGPEADNNELEIGNHHYPGPTGPEIYKRSKRPIVFDEYYHLNAYNRYELASDPGLREFWGEALVSMWNDMYHSEGVLGGALWAAIDDSFFPPIGGAVGYGTWGPIDGWRRLKPEFYEMKRAYNPILVTLVGNTSPTGIVTFDIENRNFFTNISECQVEWETNHARGTLSMDILPGKSSTVELKLPIEALKDSSICIRTFDLQRRETGANWFQLLPTFTSLPSIGKGKVILKENEVSYTINSLSGTYSIDKRSGMLTSLSKVQQSSLIQSPALMLLPLNADGDGIQMTGKSQDYEPFNPTCENWISKEISVESRKYSTKFVVKGTYNEAEGYFSYEFLTSGEVIIDYNFTLLKSVSPRQIGIVFTLPKTFSQFDWSCKASQFMYPVSTLGAKEGRVDAFNDNLPIVGMAGPNKEPTWEWGFDQTKAGSNLFRSTKRFIREASLTNVSGNVSFHIYSDGNQHARAWIEGDVIRLLIADYINAGSEKFLTSHSEVAYKPLKAGDKVAGSIRIHQK